jgi:hypothetical protein
MTLSTTPVLDPVVVTINVLSSARQIPAALPPPNAEGERNRD